MSYYLVKTNQVIEGQSGLFDFYYYGYLDNQGTPMESYWGLDETKKEIFSNVDDAELVLNDLTKTPPNFRGAEIVSV